MRKILWIAVIAILSVPALAAASEVSWSVGGSYYSGRGYLSGHFSSGHYGYGRHDFRGHRYGNPFWGYPRVHLGWPYSGPYYRYIPSYYYRSLPPVVVVQTRPIYVPRPYVQRVVVEERRIETSASPTGEHLPNGCDNLELGGAMGRGYEQYRNADSGTVGAVNTAPNVANRWSVLQDRNTFRAVTSTEWSRLMGCHVATEAAFRSQPGLTELKHSVSEFGADQR